MNTSHAGTFPPERATKKFVIHKLRKKRHDEPKQKLPPFYGTAAVALGLERCILTGKRGSCPFRHDLGRGIMIRAIVCPHVRWVGRPWVVISKTLGKPVNGLSAASLPAWFPNAGGRAANTA